MVAEAVGATADRSSRCTETVVEALVRKLLALLSALREKVEETERRMLEMRVTVESDVAFVA